MKLATLSAALFFHSFTYGQNIIYKQTNKILEYNYGVVDTAGMRKLSEIEKIKYELKFVEKSYSETIFQNYDSEFEIKIDSNEYEQSWMKLAKRFKYSNAGMELYDGNNTLMKTIAYTPEQLAARTEKKDYIRYYGFHPGLISFPDFTPAVITQLATQNVIVTTLPTGEFKVVANGETTTYNKAKNTIVTEFTNKDGVKCKITDGYEPYGTNGGYLHRVQKSERQVYSVNGPCITETKLTYYNDYNIQDDGGLMAKATDALETVTVFPNPSDGVFTAKVQLGLNRTISSVKVVNLLNGSVTNIDNNGQTTFLVNLPNLPSGNYALQVLTSTQKLLSVNFIKL